MLILLFICVFAFSACDNNNQPQTPSNPTDGTTENGTHVHSFGNWVVLKEATCTAKGEKERSCSCGEKETANIDLVAHTEVVDEAVPATCTADGKTEGKHCSVCNETIIAQTIIPATHTDGEFIIDVPSTIYEEGIQHQLCDICEQTIQTNIPVPRIVSTGLAYQVNPNGNTCTIIRIGTCTDTEIGIPETIDGYTVTAIGDNAFDGSTNVQGIYIPETISYIGNRAFYKCSAISEIRIPSTVLQIGKQIFMGCDSLEIVYYDSSYAPMEGETFFKNEAIKKVVFGDNLTTIPDYICYNCENLEEIVLSKNTKQIGHYAFYCCTSLTEINLPDGLINTGWYAFRGLKIKELVIPDSVTNIHNSFRECDELERIVFPVSIISVPSQTFYICGSIKEVYYKGNQLDWSGINVAESSTALLEAEVFFYSEFEPADEGNYWHFVDGVITKW